MLSFVHGDHTTSQSSNVSGWWRFYLPCIFTGLTVYFTAYWKATDLVDLIAGIMSDIEWWLNISFYKGSLGYSNDDSSALAFIIKPVVVMMNVGGTGSLYPTTRSLTDPTMRGLQKCPLFFHH